MHLSLKSRCNLFLQGDDGGALYILLNGWVALSTLIGGNRRRIIGFALPGAVLVSANSPAGAAEYTAQALTDSLVYMVRREDRQEWSRDNFDIRIQQAIWISRRACESHNHLCNPGERAALDSIANVLLDLFIRARLLWPTVRADEIHLPLTHVEIAGVTGFTDELVNRILQELKADGVLERHRGSLCIVDPSKLIDIPKQTSIERICMLLRPPK